MKKYECSICGYIYNPKNGDKDAAIAPGTPFDALPEDWTCPICRVDKSHFVEISEDMQDKAPQNDNPIEGIKYSECDYDGKTPCEG